MQRICYKQEPLVIIINLNLLQCGKFLKLFVMKKNLFFIAMISVLGISSCTNLEEPCMNPTAISDETMIIPTWETEYAEGTLFYAIDSINYCYEQIIREQPEGSIDNNDGWIGIVGADIGGALIGAKMGVPIGSALGCVSGGTGMIVTVGVCGILGAVCSSMLAADPDAMNLDFLRDNFCTEEIVQEEGLFFIDDLYRTSILMGQLHNQLCQDLLYDYPDVNFSQMPRDELFDFLLRAYKNRVPHSILEEEYVAGMVLDSFINGDINCMNNENLENIALECKEIFFNIREPEMRNQYAYSIMEVATSYCQQNPDEWLECISISSMFGVAIYSSQLWIVN